MIGVKLGVIQGILLFRGLFGLSVPFGWSIDRHSFFSAFRRFLSVVASTTVFTMKQTLPMNCSYQVSPQITVKYNGFKCRLSLNSNKNSALLETDSKDVENQYKGSGFTGLFNTEEYGTDTGTIQNLCGSIKSHKNVLFRLPSSETVIICRDQTLQQPSNK